MARGGQQRRRGDVVAGLPPAPAADTAEPIAAPIATHLASGEWVAMAPDADGVPIGGCGATAEEAIADAEQAASAESFAGESLSDEPVSNSASIDPVVAPWLAARIAAGSTHEAARDALAVILDPIGEQARERFSACEPHDAVDAWYEAHVRAALGAPLAAPQRHPLIPFGHDRRRVLCHLGAWGYADDGHRRESWSPGDVGWFQSHVYYSVPGATVEA